MKRIKLILFPLVLILCQLTFTQTPVKKEQKDIPVILSDLLNEEILLTDNKTRITLEDFKEHTVILSFVEAWSNPSVNTISFLDAFYKEKKTTNLKVIAISSKSSDKEKQRLKKFVKKRKLSIQTGWVDVNFRSDFFKLANASGIPLSFVIKDGKIQGIFIGDAPQIHQEIKELIIKLEQE